jgi:HTH-type transcriptional regulator/antitoxin HipB
MQYPVHLLDQLPQQLKAIRKSRKLSQSQLAQKLGVTQARIAAIEANPSVVGIGQLFELLTALGMQLVLLDTAVVEQTAEPVTDDYIPKGSW